LAIIRLNEKKVRRQAETKSEVLGCRQLLEKREKIWKEILEHSAWREEENSNAKLEKLGLKGAGEKS
jgi:shikimate kinase